MTLKEAHHHTLCLTEEVTPGTPAQAGEKAAGEKWDRGQQEEELCPSQGKAPCSQLSLRHAEL